MKQLLFVLLVAVTVGCSGRGLRGWAESSSDGRTYLVIDDDNGGACGPITVDGQQWPHAIKRRGEIKPGRHVIRCGTEIEFDIAASTVFHFDYWGP